MSPYLRSFIRYAYPFPFLRTYPHPPIHCTSPDSFPLVIRHTPRGKRNVRLTSRPRVHLSQRLVFGRLCFARASPRVLFQFRAHSTSDGFGSVYGYRRSLSGIHSPRSLILRVPHLRAGEGGRTRRVDRSSFVVEPTDRLCEVSISLPLPPAWKRRCAFFPSAFRTRSRSSRFRIAGVRKHTPYSFACPCPGYQAYDGKEDRMGGGRAAGAPRARVHTRAPALRPLFIVRLYACPVWHARRSIPPSARPRVPSPSSAPAPSCKSSPSVGYRVASALRAASPPSREGREGYASSSAASRHGLGGRACSKREMEDEGQSR
ncbi:hypothetical protein B0H13DRAFT_2301108 [Mycena leptocephala]|nr:hypothetical protein B0H13DRAFT_2301108 [Mycena leptocephala]